MRLRAFRKFHPDLESLEAKQLLNATPLAAHAAKIDARHSVATSAASVQAADIASRRTSLPTRFLAFRITNPSVHKVNLIPPFQQVLVQSKQPVPGQVYNVLQIAVKNQTSQTFDASNGFTVRMTNQTHAHAYPILTGTQQWKPNQWFVFYVLTKKYYPVSEVAGGFQLNLGGASSTLVPGPSGIFLRLKYDPATFAKTLDWIVAYGQGAQLGNGPPVGMPDTAINAIVAAGTNRIDFGGRF